LQWLAVVAITEETGVLLLAARAGHAALLIATDQLRLHVFIRACRPHGAALLAAAFDELIGNSADGAI